MTVDTPYEILIVGAGIFGVSTAYHLSLQTPQPRILLLDRSPAPPLPAASTDLNKIIRADYTNPLYMALGFEAIEAWQSHPCFQAAGVHHPTGWICMDEKDSKTAIRVRENFHRAGHDDCVVDMTEEEVRQAWGGLLQQTDCSPFGSYYFNPSAGWADAGKALQILTHEAVQRGVRFKTGEARRITRDNGGSLGVKTADGTVYRADKVVLATGAWTSQLMSSIEDELELPDVNRVERQITAAGVCVSHFRLTPAEQERYAQLPVFVYGGQGEVIPPTADGILKFTTASSFTNTIQTASGHEISVPVQDQLTVPQKLQERHLNEIRPRLPELLNEGRRRPEWYRLCWDAISPSQHPLITRHPDPRLANLYLAVGGSFHSYKFLPTIGRYVVNVLQGVSNGPEKDEAWAWKTIQPDEKGVHEKLIPSTEFRELV
ncbi:NAD(P)/FAD-dependent oxidoreductase [Aspergillus homomorphus CBS 101889]|uniref:FAD/NAD(P)-binding domain-containing protein n=1 Tax=Aspergillus homomorphus (strain CBS 101889) TaxID=1450537 RepID=A0A395I048_ASPHC|nr:FAD/NAD(P)-binding domain-containing protein [Aspergillus homomorphus CBS 101889]RAL13307.1 FAD/NAD(P)-binding domain-containing protein [Aspergillus homomorphus CBS 101889]